MFKLNAFSSVNIRFNPYFAGAFTYYFIPANAGLNLIDMLECYTFVHTVWLHVFELTVVNASWSMIAISNWLLISLLFICNPTLLQKFL